MPGGSATIDRDEGFIAGAAAGYQFGQFRAELNGDYSRNGVKSASVGGVTSSVGGHTQNISIMANGLYDIPLGLPIVPYIGAGAGATDFGDGSADKWGFAIQPIVGVSYSITPQISIAGEYRYLYGVDDVHINGATFTNREHHFLLSATWHFGAPAAPPTPGRGAARAAAGRGRAGAADVHRVLRVRQVGAHRRRPKVVDAAAAAFKSGKSGVAIAGYTDLAGTQQYNLALSKRRADTVKAALVKDGVPAAAIDASWHGKENPRVPTADGVREPQNRRVEITM